MRFLKHKKTEKLKKKNESNMKIEYFPKIIKIFMVIEINGIFLNSHENILLYFWNRLQSKLFIVDIFKLKKKKKKNISSMSFVINT